MGVKLRRVFTLASLYVKKKDRNFEEGKVSPERRGEQERAFDDLAGFCSRVLGNPEYVKLVEMFGYKNAEPMITKKDRAIYGTAAVDEVEEQFRPDSEKEYSEIKQRINDKLDKRGMGVPWYDDTAAFNFAYKDAIPGLMLIAAAILNEDITEIEGVGLIWDCCSYFEEWKNLKPVEVWNRGNYVREKHS